MGSSTPNAGNNDDNEDVAMKPPAITASPSWPCANCQTTVSSERCPTCHGIQVRIVGGTQKLTTADAAWLERLSPALFSRGTPTPAAAAADEEEYAFRPLDPVACILESAPSPVVDLQQKMSALKEIEDRLRLRKRPLVADLPHPKKSKWLSAV